MNGYSSVNEYTSEFISTCSQTSIINSLSMQGAEVPRINYALELGYGQGLNICFNSVLHNTCWYGTDFNPVHYDNAVELAELLCVSPKLFDMDFAEFSKINNLPKFDLIVLHGVWSWIDAVSREAIVNIIESFLSEKGLVYISYNTEQVWGRFKVLQKVLRDLVREQNYTIHEALLELKKLLLALPKTDHVACLSHDIEYFLNSDLSYVSHELMNETWEPTSIETIRKDFNYQLRFHSSVDVLDTLWDQIVKVSENKVLSGLNNDLRSDLKTSLQSKVHREDIWAINHIECNLLSLLHKKFIVSKDITELPDKLPRSYGAIQLKSELFREFYQKCTVGGVYDYAEVFGELNIEKISLYYLLYNCGMLDMYFGEDETRSQIISANKKLAQQKKFKYFLSPITKRPYKFEDEDFKHVSEYLGSESVERTLTIPRAKPSLMHYLGNLKIL